MADAYFTTYGGNAIEALNGCDDADDLALNCFDYGDRPELNGNEDIDSWEWHSPILDDDYFFVVPAPPVRTAPSRTSRWCGTSRTAAARFRPTHHPQQARLPGSRRRRSRRARAYTVYSSDRPIGNATCNPTPAGASPFTVEEDPAGTAGWNRTGSRRSA